MQYSILCYILSTDTPGPSLRVKLVRRRRPITPGRPSEAGVA